MINKIEDEEAIKIMQEIAKEENLVKIQNYEINRKRELIEKFIKIDGIKKVQIARILGINRITIERMQKKMYTATVTGKALTVDSKKGHMLQSETSPM